MIYLLVTCLAASIDADWCNEPIPDPRSRPSAPSTIGHRIPAIWSSSTAAMALTRRLRNSPDWKPPSGPGPRSIWTRYWRENGRNSKYRPQHGWNLPERFRQAPNCGDSQGAFTEHTRDRRKKPGLWRRRADAKSGDYQRRALFIVRSSDARFCG